MRRDRPWIIVALALLCVSIPLVWLKSQRYETRCTVVNETDEGAAVTISIYGRRFSVDELPPGKSFSFAFDSGSDAHYSVSVEFASGSAYEEKTGYVTSGIDIDHVLEIHKHGTTIKMAD